MHTFIPYPKPNPNPNPNPNPEQAPLALEMDSPPEGEQVVTRDVERVATQAALLQRSDTFRADLRQSAPAIPIGAALGAPVVLNTAPVVSVPRPLPPAMPVDGSLAAGLKPAHGSPAAPPYWPSPADPAPLAPGPSN